MTDTPSNRNQEIMMFRKTILALAAIAAIGGAAVATASDASAKGFKGGHGKHFHGKHFHGKHFHGHHHHGHWGHRGVRLGFYGGPTYAYAPDCVRVITPRGFVKRVCYY